MQQSNNYPRLISGITGSLSKALLSHLQPNSERPLLRKFPQESSTSTSQPFRQGLHRFPPQASQPGQSIRFLRLASDRRGPFRSKRTNRSGPSFIPEREVRGENLYRYAPLELKVTRTIYDPHATTADLSFQLVRSGEDIGQPRRQRFVTRLIHVALAPNAPYINAPPKPGQPEP